MKIFDCHSDTMTDIMTKRRKGEKEIIRRYHTPDYNKGEVGGIMYGLWTDPDMDDHQTSLFRTLGSAFEEFDEMDTAELAYNSDDVRRIQATGKVAIMLGIEGFDGFKGDISLLHMMYNLGFRHGMLTWNNDNAFAAGIGHIGPGDGLTNLGKEALKVMEDLHMIIDVSHASEKTFWDIMENTTSPVIASHSNAYALCPDKRNLKDEQIKAIAKRGGVIGMNSWSAFIDKHDANVDKLAEHAKYISDLVGVEHVCCGFDFCWYLEDEDGEDEENMTPGIGRSSDAQNFLNALSDKGMNNQEIEAIAENNILTAFDKILK